MSRLTVHTSQCINKIENQVQNYSTQLSEETDKHITTILQWCNDNTKQCSDIMQQIKLELENIIDWEEDIKEMLDEIEDEEKKGPSFKI